MSAISVTIPTKDRLLHLKRAITMFLAQPKVGEVIVVADGCKDGTVEYLKFLSQEDTRVRYVDNGINRGLPYSRNVGAQLAQCEYVFTGEDDLEIADNFFETLLDHMRLSGADIISARNIFRLDTETADEALQRMAQLTGAAVDRRALAVHTGIAAAKDQPQLLLPAPMLIKREVFDSIRFDVRYEVNFWREESDFQLSAHESGLSLFYCPHTVSFNFVITNDRGGAHAAAGLRRVAWLVKNNWRFINKHRDLIKSSFDIGSPYIYITKFAIKRVYAEFALPAAVSLVRRTFLSLKRNS